MLETFEKTKHFVSSPSMKCHFYDGLCFPNYFEETVNCLPFSGYDLEYYLSPQSPSSSESVPTPRSRISLRLQNPSDLTNPDLKVVAVINWRRKFATVIFRGRNFCQQTIFASSRARYVSYEIRQLVLSFRIVNSCNNTGDISSFTSLAP